MRGYLLLLLIFGGFLYFMSQQAVRGIRNNNPLNIRVGNDWQGEAFISRDAEFETFSHHKYGFRAGAKVLRNYQSIHGLNTVREMIYRFAPKNENDSDNYARFVAKGIGVGLDEPINLSSDDLLAKMLHTMSIMEVGRYYSVADAMQGVQLA